MTEVRKSKKDVTSDEIEEERVLGGDDTPKRKDAGGTLASGDKAPKEEERVKVVVELLVSQRMTRGDDAPKREDARGTLASGDKAPKEEGKRDIEQRVLSKSKEIEGDSSKRGDC